MVECGGFENRYPDFFGIVSSNLTLSAHVLVVQLDRASGSEPEDRGFDPLRGHQIKLGFAYENSIFGRRGGL